MLSNQPVLRRGAAGISAFLALVCAGGAAAGMFTTAESVEDFNVDWANDRIIYSYPTLDQVELRISEDDNRVVILTGLNAEVEVATQGGGLTGSALFLRGDQGSGGPTSYAGKFGVLQEFESPGDGVAVTLDAMESAGGDPTGNGYPTWLAFLLSGPTTGSDAADLRSYGLYVHLHGLSEEYWVQLTESGGSSIGNMLRDEGTPMIAQSVNGPEVPAPATPVLLLAGLLGWRAARRRR